MTEYDFSHISEARNAVDALYLNQDGTERIPTDDEKKHLQAAIKEFYRSRTICEMMDIYDWSDETDETSIFDYEPWLQTPFETEMELRSVWLPDDVTKALNAVLPSWSGSNSIITRVDGIQKKLDRIAKLLENVQITTTAKSILEL